MVASIEEVSSSLVREYLSRKGLKRTMACLEEELPRTEASINNRAHLRQMLSIESLYRRNKVQNSPLKTLLEIIVKHHMEQLNLNKITINESNPPQSATIAGVISKTPSQTVINGSEESTPAFDDGKMTKLRSDVQETYTSKSTNKSPLPEKCRLSSHDQTDFPTFDLKDQSSVAFHQDGGSVIQKEPEKNASVFENLQRSRTNRIRRGMMAGPIPQESNRKRPSRKAEVSQSLLRKEEENRPSRDGLLLTGSLQNSSESSQTVISSPDYEGEKDEALARRVNTDTENTFEKVQQNIAKTKKIKIKSNVADLNLSEMVLDDIDDDENLSELSRGSLLTAPAEHGFVGRHMDQHTAAELKAVLLGSSLNCFSVEWRNQGFTFSETFDLRYGIVQKKGGPCGVLASIQAFLLKTLLFENMEVCNNLLQQLKPSNATRRRCLVLAVAEVLWRAGEEEQATIAINSGRTQFVPTRHYKSDGVLEKIMCFTVDNIRDLRLLVEQHIEQFETGALGCLLLTISAVLSRSIEKVREDMDVPTTTLIGAHGYCTQELVNLLLCGRSVSNVFDNEMDLDSGNGNVTLLKGIKSQCDVGFLSLFEHYNICKVGAHLKSPRYPIWVVCSESHFSVLFGLQRELLTYEDKGLEFDLYYYDGLANQQEEIRLTVSLGKRTSSGHGDDTDLIPPLDLCIRTRWKDASVNWNDTEPIL